LDIAFIHSSTYHIGPTKEDSTYGMLEDKVSRRATKNVECANVFLPFMLHAYECCTAKLICVRH